MSTISPRAAQGAFLACLLWPTLGLVVLGFILVAVTVAGTSSSADDAALQREHALLGTYLDRRVGEVRGRAEALVGAGRAGASPIGVDPLRSSGLPLDGLSGVMLVDAKGAVRAHRSYDPVGAGPIRALEAEVAAASTPGAQGLSAGRVLFDGSQPVVAAAAPAGEAGHLLAYRRLTSDDVAALARRFGLTDLGVTTTPAPGAATLPVASGTGAGSASFAWTPSRPGREARQQLVPALLAGALIAALLLAIYLVSIRRVMRNLAESQEQAERLIGRDPLSGLPNRTLFAERLDQELSRTVRTGEGLAVLFLDLDRFKDVNDTFGHGVGDALLKEVALRLVELLRGEDTLARFGGDEFAIIQTRTDGGLDASALSQRILDALTQPFDLNGTSVSVGVSIGIALAPSDGLERETLMRLADTALYQAKSEGRNRSCFFAREMDETIQLRKVVEDDLRHAIKRDELVLHYQPIYAADGTTLVAVEALVRWPHPTQGMVSPAKFVPIAEERGLIIPLGEWVLRRACRDAARWPGVRLAVNVSAIQFHHRDFVRSVQRATQESGFDPANLEIELTEGVLVDDEDAAEEAMMELRALGVHLALDDFGTGYSSLIYLRRFAFDKIKIDRSFLASMEATGESAILLHSIVHLGRALGLVVTAEGVETREQHRFLQALGCHQLQGFLFSPGVPADAIDALVATRTQAAA